MTDLLLRYPQAGAVTEDPMIRRVTTRPYPYLVFYEAIDDETSFMRCATARAIHSMIRDQGKLLRRLGVIALHFCVA